MNQVFFSFNEDTAEVGSNVLTSILNSRIDQIDAITLPSDKHRKDIIAAIHGISSYPKRLSSFLDYLIDYTYQLNLEISHKQDQLNNALDELACLKKNKHSNSTRGGSELKIRNLSHLLGVHESNLEDTVKSLKQFHDNHIDKQNEDYALSLKLLNATEGNLYESLKLIVDENARGNHRKIKNSDKRTKTTKHYNERFLDSEYSCDSFQRIDGGDLRDQFNQIEADLIKLKDQVKHKFSVLQTKQEQ